MNQLTLFVALAALSLSGLAQAASLGSRAYDKQDLEKFYETLTKLEDAHKENREPTVNHLDLSHVAKVVKALDEPGEVKFVQESMPLTTVLANAIRKHAQLSEHSSCDEECAKQVVAEYQANRPAELTGEAHNFSGTKCELLADILLKRDPSPLTDDHIHAAMNEYKSYSERMTSLGDSAPLSFSLYNIERAVDYNHRFAGRIVAAMWPYYNFRIESENFANTFKQFVYELLHANGYGIRNGQLINIPKSYPEFKP